ncbi:hypothetical protein R50073_44280 [Maricurvus nonylphenolicus]
MVSGISKCQEASSFIKGLKSFFGVKNATGFYVTADISSQNKTLANNIVILSYLVDDLNNTNSNCETVSLNGYLTPYFKVNPGLDIEISYKIHYTDNNSIETVKKLKERSESIIDHFAPKSVGVLINKVFSPIIAPLDSAIESSLNVIATDTLTTHFSLNTAVGQDRIDGSRLDFSPIFPNNQKLSRGIGAKFNLLYYKSVIGLGQEQVIYEDDPSQMLSSILDGTRNNLDVYAVLQQNEINGLVANSLKVYKDKEHTRHLEEACRHIKNYASKDLGLTKDDALAFRWATLTEFSNYNNHLDIRTDICFRQHELQRLIDLNRNYIFKVARDIIPSERANYVNDMLNVFGSTVLSDKSTNKDMYDMENLTLFISLSDPLPTDIEDLLNKESDKKEKNRLYEGEEAFTKIQKILKRARCGRISSTSPHDDLAFVGKLDTSFGPKYVLGGLQVDKYGKKNKIKTIYLADIDLIQQHIKPYKEWPIGQTEGLCPKEGDRYLISGL